jgi:iron(III) transport system substrate-binding protein
MNRRSFALLASAAMAGCSRSRSTAGNEVVVYTSVDDIFARPVCEAFEHQSGISVKLVPDTEETKSTGLMNRLIAEKGKPVADVFWSGDPMRAAVLKRKGISASYRSPNAEGMAEGFSDKDGHWAALSARARVIIYNTQQVPAGQTPKGMADFLDSKWKGRTGLANPLFGTSSMHAAAWFETMGDAKAQEFFAALRTNGVKMLSSNGEVKRRVGDGEFAFGLTDTDDVNEAIKDGKPVSAVYPDASGGGTLIIPNAVVLIEGGPHTHNGQRFIDFLLTSQVEEMLAASAAQMPLRPGVKAPSNVQSVSAIKAMAVDYEKLSVRIESLAGGFLKEWAAKP